MGSVLIDSIGELVTCDGEGPDGLGLSTDASVVIDDDRVAWIGPAGLAPAADMRVDARGRAVVPGFVDSHAHLVFAGDRSAEFAARMAGVPYTAGGIRTTVAQTREASDDELRGNIARLVRELVQSGSTTFEIKSGYGLTTGDEARSVMLAREFTDEVTFLGAHVVPADYEGDTQGYVDLVCGAMLDACSADSKWVDVFCDRGAFDADQARQVLSAGKDKGLIPKVHANQLQQGPGVTVAVEMGAASADHCTHLNSSDIELLADSARSPSPTVATLLPGAEFSTRSPYPDARRLIDAGVMVALATDCNPGTSYTTSMAFCIAVAVREMRMTLPEALLAATVGGARALRRTDVGQITVGGTADLVLLDAPSYVHLAYRPGVDLIAEVWRTGTPMRGGLL